MPFIFGQAHPRDDTAATLLRLETLRRDLQALAEGKPHRFGLARRRRVRKKLAAAKAAKFREETSKKVRGMASRRTR